MRGALKEIRGRRGFVSVFTAALMFSLIGMAVLITDVGMLYLNHTQLENMADAGALAGAQEYMIGDQTMVVSVAENYARDRNGKPGDGVSVDIREATNMIVVGTERDVPLFFAKIFNLISPSSDAFVTVWATSAARILPVSGVSNAVPFGITWTEDFENGLATGVTFTLKVDEKEEFKGNFHSLRLKSKSGGDSGASVLAENIVYGCAQSLSIGDQVKTETGNMVGPIKQAIIDRLAISGGNIVIVPIIEETWTDLGGGIQQVTIKGFGAFEIDSSNGKTVTGKFIQMVTAADELVTQADREANYGLYGTKLVDPNVNL